jgi:hypothetical protein
MNACLYCGKIMDEYHLDLFCCKECKIKYEEKTANKKD